MSDATPKHRRWRFRFSLRLLLVVTAVVAAVVAISINRYRANLASRRPSLFYQAVRKGDLAEVDRLLKIDPRLAHGRQHGDGSFSHTPLQMALRFAQTYNPQVVERILKEKPDVNESSAGLTALHIAAQLNYLAEVRRLIQLGANLNVMDGRAHTPLHLGVNAALIGPDRTGQVVKLLLDAGADPNIVPSHPPPDWKSPLQAAVHSANPLVVTFLLDAGARVNDRDTAGQTALHVAAARDNSTVARLLIEHGADLSAKDNDGLIPGQRADGTNSETAADTWWDKIEQSLRKGEVARLNHLLDAAPQALSFRTEHLTMFGRALYYRRLDVLDYLLDRHTEPEMRRMQANRYLHWACADSPVDFAKCLFDGGADLEAKDELGQTPLHAAARGHNHAVLRMLLAKGAEIGAIDNHGTTVLDAAFELSFPDSTGRQTLDLLRAAGHPPTILYAAAVGDLDSLRKLTGADLELLDRGYTRAGTRPLHAAVLGRQPDAVKWLLAERVEPTPPRPEGWMYGSHTPLMAAISRNDAVIAESLIESGARVNRQNSRGEYPAHAVIQWDRDPTILEVLLAHGADPTLKYQDKTAVELAKRSTSQHRDRYLELLEAATRKSAAER